MAAPKVEVKQEEGAEIPVEILAKAIADIAAGMERVNKSRLTRAALIILIKAETGVPQYQIERVLNCLEQLEKIYCKPRIKR